MRTGPAKRYDQAYFDRWYRDPEHRVGTPADLERKIAMVLAISEHYLGRKLRNVLDVGCGEAPWQPVLKRLRPGLHYLGLDSSEYVVGRYGLQRNIRPLRFGQLAEQRFEVGPFDLLICADMLHYVPSTELLRGLSGFAELCDGVAYLELMCKEDDFLGDHAGFLARTRQWYRKRFLDAGFLSVGSHCYLGERLRMGTMALERS